MADTTFLRWPFFDASHRALAAALELWIDEEVALHDHDEQEVDARSLAFVASLGAAGWLRYCVPAAHGGAFDSLDVRTLCLIREMLARTSGLADFAFAMQGLGSTPITLFGSDALKKRYLPAIGRGERVAAFALSEADAGSDVGAMRTTARRDTDGSYVLDGSKTWTSNGGLAHQYVVFARTSATDDGTRGLSAFVVDAETPGLRIAERITVSAPHPLGSLAFERCRVPADNLLGREGHGFKIAMSTLDLFRSTVGAAALGFARRALDEAVARVRRRHAFGQPLAEHQIVQAYLAEMAIDVDTSALLVYRAAWTKDVAGAPRITREAAMAKLHATEAAQRVVDRAVQLFGGLGVMSGVPVERLYREVRTLRIYEGTSEIQKLVIARQVIGAARSP